VFDGMVQVVGNLRFFLLVFGMLAILVMGSKWWEIKYAALAAVIWLGGNLLFDVVLRSMKTGSDKSPMNLFQPMKVGETRYLIFLLLMSGFWTSFNQIFMTLPEYIRDYGNTSDLINSLGGTANWITGLFSNMGFNTSEWGKAVLENGQVKPEHLINLNALGIIAFQIVISHLSRKLKPFTTIISGVGITVFSFLVYILGTGGWVIVSGILVFSVGEMLASPKSKEYAGRIAPPDKVGMYMGYFYWCVALGNLFGGLLSGVSYAYFGPKGIDNPDMMWVLFAGLALISAFLLAGYNRWVTKS
jgi:dipeptide/tripeptide permease